MKPNQKILVVGSGGREHALVWKIRQSPYCGKIYCAPGNAGTAEIAQNVNIKVSEIHELSAFARHENIDLTIVGPEDPLGRGIVNIFKLAGQRIFGPTQGAAQIELSKSFAHSVMDAANVPSAEYKVFDDFGLAVAYVREKGGAFVVKANGAALGKGVKICWSPEEAKYQLHKIMIEKIHGEVAGRIVVIEELLEGIELSAHVLCDGRNAILLPLAMDHKRIGDGDTGENTGGMGAFAPVRFDPATLEAANIIREQEDHILNKIVYPILREMEWRGKPYQGLLYPGMMLTEEGLKVLEFNARFGDPETQPLMMLAESDLLELLNAAAVEGNLDTARALWRPGYAMTVVMSSEGYPETSSASVPITIDPGLKPRDDLMIFHAGTRRDENGQLFTNGGRVLGVTAYGETLRKAHDKAYEAIEQIHFDGEYYRSDIGEKVLQGMRR